MPFADNPVVAFGRYVRRIFFGTLSLILAAAGISFLMGHQPWARGLILGGIASLVNLVVMAGDVRRQGKTLDGQLVRPAYSRYAIRMTVTAAALVYAAVRADITLWAAIPALFASQVVMTCQEVLGGRKRETT